MKVGEHSMKANEKEALRWEPLTERNEEEVKPEKTGEKKKVNEKNDMTCRGKEEERWERLKKNWRSGKIPQSSKEKTEKCEEKEKVLYPNIVFSLLSMSK